MYYHGLYETVSFSGILDFFEQNTRFLQEKQIKCKNFELKM